MTSVEIMMHPVVVCHGGVQSVSDLNSTVVHEAATAGYQILANNGSALDAVVESVRVLEDCPALNAALGSNLQLDGVVRCDAGVMTSSGHYGACIGTSIIKNPILLAKEIVHHRVNLLHGQYADKFGKDKGLAAVDNSYFKVEKRLSRWKDSQTLAGCDTVGAVAIDKDGLLAAASSTGGLTTCIPGRVGDSAISGQGLAVDPEIGAITATGTGEFIAKQCTSKDVLQKIKYLKLDPLTAAKETFQEYKTQFREDAIAAIFVSNDGVPCIYAESDSLEWAVVGDKFNASGFHNHDKNLFATS